jgi:sterol desaturase/sphingolipid hydroxylase (fatty acid hydroxylase superfamily)
MTPSWTRPEDVEAFAFVVFTSLFLLAEWWRPARRGRRELVLDLVAIAALDGAARLWRWLITSALGGTGPGMAAGAPAWLRVLLVLAIGDLLLYGVHRAMHWPSLWRTHHFHHSAMQLDALSGFRASLLHVGLFLLPFLTLTHGVFRLGPGELATVLAVAAFFQLWTHTNARLSLGPLDALIVSPAAHRVHHLSLRGDASVNFGMIFTVWDRAFGTWRAPRPSDDAASMGVPLPPRLLARLRALVGC